MLNKDAMVKEKAENKPKKEDLADYVKRIRREKGLSLKEVVLRSEGRISNGYISQIENRYYINPTRDKLTALAKGLGVSEDDVFAVARGKSLDESETVDAEMALFASRVKKLTPQQRRDFQIAWQMAKDYLDRLEREKERNAE